MDNLIHPTAIVHPTARLGKNNYIGPYCLIGPNAEIGDFNRFEAYVSIAQPAEHWKFFTQPGRVRIGSNNTVREFTTINAGTNDQTVMGSFCTMLRGSHLSHDSVLEDWVTLSCNVLVGGESRIMRGANLGLGAIVHQRSIVGSYCMLGMGTVGTKRSRFYPGGIFIGAPARFRAQNQTGLHRHGIDGEALQEEIARWERFRQGRTE